MAKTPVPELTYLGYCPDCGERKVKLPPTLPRLGDDFDWQVRDYDGFRRFMLEELAARFPERVRWTAGDMEVVLVEVFAAVLDQLSDMADRVAVEAFLETARRPDSVRRLLGMIGYDAVRMDQARRPAAERLEGRAALERLERDWQNNPHLMDQARRDGPRLIHTQQRMVSVHDYAVRLEEHPLALRAHAWAEWTGSWPTVRVAIIGWGGHGIDRAGIAYPGDLREEVEAFHHERGFSLPDLSLQPAIRTILRPYIEAYRMTGQEVVLQDAVPVGIAMALSIRVADGYFQSEVRRAVADVLGTGPSGFFEPGRLRFGEDLHAADIYQVLMAQDGVENVCLNRFKKIGDQYTNQASTGWIELSGLEIAVCDNDPARPQNGYYRITLHGGRKG